MEDHGEEQSKIRLIRGSHPLTSLPATSSAGYADIERTPPPEIRINSVDDIWRINMDFMRRQTTNGIYGDRMTAILELNRKHFSWLVFARFDSVNLVETGGGGSFYGSPEMNDCQKYYVFSEMELKYSKNIDFNGIIFSPCYSTRGDSAILAVKTMKEAMFSAARVDFKTEMLMDGMASSGRGGNNGYNVQNTSAKRSNLRRIIADGWDACAPIGCCGYVAFRPNNSSISTEFPLYR